ncbi:DUF3822 family protein [Flagellimonas myxillae]|uniref:DUF3822 family protein n=1 Tax=Flagellimonas myxillae TaxID=2942214 RepID=UPI00201F23BC|nr:DUF3822 family protein [Muricauda myxillae]MCL6266408.1 DUF3822 family protein [Muricauda myxillae]
MTEKTNNIQEQNSENTFKKLSIQVGLNGLSFCVVDTISNQILAFEKVSFKTSSTPYLVLKELKAVLNKNSTVGTQFSEVVVIHKNGLFSLVPKTLFKKEELANYLKFNTKIMANDHIAYDEIANHDMVNVYVPFANVNNHIFDLFGEFEFKHTGTVLISTLLNQTRTNNQPVCYVHVAEKEMEIVVISERKLLFYNHFEYKTKEDFLYYLLFSLEQLQMDLEKVHLKLFGLVEEGDAIFELCYTYIKTVSVFVPTDANYPLEQLESQAIDFTSISKL